MLKAKLDSARKNKKGFSLVELIIVMAIMVALIAVLAPQFVKYVQRARDSSVSDAAENVYEMVKSEYALGNIGGNGTFVIKSAYPSKGMSVTTTGSFTYAGEYTTLDEFIEYCGVDDTKSVNSKVEYTVTVTVDATSGYPSFSMAQTKDSAGNAITAST